MFIVAVGLIASKPHRSSEILKLFSRRHYAVYYAYGCRTENHSASVLYYPAHFVLLSVSQMYAYQPVVQQVSLFEEIHSPLAVTHHHLLGLSVALRQVHVYESALLSGQFLSFEQDFLAHEVGSLRRKHYSYSVSLGSVPLVEYFHGLPESLLGIAFIVII